MLQLLLFALAALIPCWYGYRRSVSHGWAEINHVTTFTFGYLFYWITPLAARIFAPKVDIPLARVWAGLFREHLVAPYALSCIGLYVCFMLGDTFGRRSFQGRHAGPSRPIPTLALTLVTFFGTAFLLYSAYAVRAHLFQHAEPGTTQVGVARGAVTAWVVLLGCVALMFSIQHPQMPWRRLVFTRYFVPAILGGGTVLALGSRLYVASLLLMILITHSLLRARIRLRTVIVAVLIAAAFFGLVGTWREGSSPKGALFNVFLEPMIGSLSLVHHLYYKGIAWTNYPDLLISDLVNLIPTLLMPDKIKLLKEPEVYRPLGGTHSFVSFNLNFGLLGTAVFLFVWPILFCYARSRMAETLYATMYIMCSGWLAFTFFRDPFSISLVKLIFEESIVIPIAICGLGWLLSAACSPAGDEAPLTGPEMEGA